MKLHIKCSTELKSVLQVANEFTSLLKNRKSFQVTEKEKKRPKKILKTGYNINNNCGVIIDYSIYRQNQDDKKRACLKEINKHE